MPHYVRGVINLCGTVIPVVDLRLRFGMPAREVHQIPRDHIQPAPEFRTGSDSEQFVTGLGTQEGEVKILLEIDRLMRPE